jgi:hypothetical protein
MRHRKLFARMGLFLTLAVPATIAGQTPARASKAQAAAGPVVTGVSSSVSDREASLTFFLSNGQRRVLMLRDGAVLVDGNQVATYGLDGDVAREFRRLVQWTSTLSPDEAVAAGRSWAVAGTFDGQDQGALQAITSQFRSLTPAETVPAPTPPEETPDVSAAIAGSQDAMRAARDEMQRVRDELRTTLRDQIRNEVRNKVRVQVNPTPRASFVEPVTGFFAGALGLGGAFIALCAIAFGASFFAGRQIDVMADTVSTSFGRSFLVGLLAQPLILPVLGAVIAGLTLTVVGILLIPVAIVAFAATLAAAIVGGYLAVARVAGSGMVNRLHGTHGHTPAALLQSIAWGLAIVLAVWLPAVLLGWVPMAGEALVWLAAIVTWGLATTGFGSVVLTRGGVRTTFGRRFQAPELPPTTLYERPGPEISTAEWMAGGAKQ